MPTASRSASPRLRPTSATKPSDWGPWRQRAALAPILRSWTPPRQSPRGSASAASASSTPDPSLSRAVPPKGPLPAPRMLRGLPPPAALSARISPSAPPHGHSHLMRILLRTTIAHQLNMDRDLITRTHRYRSWTQMHWPSEIQAGRAPSVARRVPPPTEPSTRRLCWPCRLRLARRQSPATEKHRLFAGKSVHIGLSDPAPASSLAMAVQRSREASFRTWAVPASQSSSTRLTSVLICLMKLRLWWMKIGVRGDLF
jgi:hypothetical protein